jgi:hypothetical protein
VLTRELRALLWLFAALALGAGLLLYVLSGNTDDTFSWTIKPSVTAAFLGGAYWAAFVLFAWSARQKLWVRARPFVLPVTVIAIGLLVATLVHFDKFHKDSLFGWFWIVAYVVVPPALALALWSQIRAPEVAPPPRVPLAGALRGLLVVEGLILIGVGLALFIAPDSADELWPWPLTPLTSRATGAFLTGFGAAALQAVMENDIGRLAGSAYAYATLGFLELVVVLRYPDALDGSDLRGVAYVVLAAAVLVTGVAGSVPARRSRLQGL